MENKIIVMKQIKPQNIFLFLFFAIIGFMCMVPFISVVIASFKNTEDLFRGGFNMSFLNENLTLSNYVHIFTGEHQYFTWYINSMIITVIQVTITLLLSASVAYGFSMYDFKFKNILFMLVLIQMMIPFEIIMIPLYQTILTIGLLDTYMGIILPSIVSPFLIIFFRQYLSGIPRDYLDAARIDGCNEYSIFIMIFLPIMKPAVVAMGIFTAIGAWNNFLWPLIVLHTSSKFTLPIGLASLVGPYGDNFKLLIAGAAFAIMPILILFIIFRKSFTEAMMVGGIKG